MNSTVLNHSMKIESKEFQEDQVFTFLKFNLCFNNINKWKK